MSRALRHPVAAGVPLLSLEECRDIARRAMSFQRGPGHMRVGVASTWRGNVRWSRNRITTAGDRRDVVVTLERSSGIVGRTLTVSRTDDAGLAEAMAQLELFLRDNPVVPDYDPLPPRPTDVPSPILWSEATASLTAAARAALVESLIAPAAAAGLVSAGFLSVGACAASWFSTRSPELYAAWTEAECSVTVRDARGGGSGWAGRSSYDWATLDPAALAATARAKCEASRDPSALEPGRYPVVLEPQAVGDLLTLVTSQLEREPAEAGNGPFADPMRPGFSRLGQRLIDPRINLTFDPLDPELGVCPFSERGDPMVRGEWFRQGVLTALAYSRPYAVSQFNENRALPATEAVRMSGGDTSLEAMIQGTRRGLLVTRFSGLQALHLESLLSTGYTRDGLWLIENGKVSRPVKNFRFTDSPLLMLNAVEALGRPVPVFRPGTPTVVPPLKATSFNFTRLVDAV